MISDFEKIKKLLNLKKEEIDNYQTDLYIKYTAERYKKLKEYVKDYTIEFFISEGCKWVSLPCYLIDDKINRTKGLLK